MFVLTRRVFCLRKINLAVTFASPSFRMSTVPKPVCIFCTIAAKEDPKTEILYEDSDSVVFRDIHPATDRHWLIVPKKHIDNAKAISAADDQVVSQLVEAGQKALTAKGIDPMDPEVRMGFHWPPFNMIHHLHLHVLHPVSKMGLLSRFYFRPDSWWFVSPEVTQEYLRQNLGKK